MTLNEYSQAALKFLNNDIQNQNDKLNLAALGLTGQSGQFADAWKKIYYHKHDININQLSLQLGDILWYIVVAAKALNLTLEDIAKLNIDKLSKRYPNGWDSKKSINRTN